MSVSVIGGNVRAIGVITATINPASVAAATSAEQTFTVPGLKVGDYAYAIKPTATAGVGIVNTRVSAADTLAITFMNATAAAVDPPSEVYTILYLRTDYAATAAID